jgi:hypothetical protein
MKIAECLSHLGDSIRLCCPAAPGETPLGREAASILLMARSYESDGRQFFRTGDPVNALASCWYASGWLHFGTAYGLLAWSGKTVPCAFGGDTEDIPASSREKLEEKTDRYCRLLDIARSSVRPAPEEDTAAYAFAGRVLCVAGAYSRYGTLYLQDGMHGQALACFSYGHGWLDAGVVTGLFSVTANREIFTI